jgi:hypothetical protein
VINHPNRNKKIEAVETEAAEIAPSPIIAYKGFDRNLSCRAFQYQVGADYAHDGFVELCRAGFHACEHPLNVFNYYPPGSSRFALVELSGQIDRGQDGDTKIAASRIHIKTELMLTELIDSAVKWVCARAKWIAGPVATGANEAATASGKQGAATASGYQGAATASGYAGKACGAEGCALFLTERNNDYEIIAVWAGIAGKSGIKPDTFYRLVGGEPVECEAEA